MISAHATIPEDREYRYTSSSGYFFKTLKKNLRNMFYFPLKAIVFGGNKVLWTLREFYKIMGLKKLKKSSVRLFMLFHHMEE